MKKIILSIGIVFLIVSCQSKTNSGKGSETVYEENETVYEESETTYEENFSAETFQAILQQLELKRENCHLKFVSQQTFPENPDLSIWLIPQITSMEDEYYLFSLACHVLLVNNQTGKIVSKYDEPLIFDSDAYRLSKISIDNPFYWLNDNALAFSVNATHASMSRASPASSTNTLLFVRQGNSLKKIFNYAADEFRGEWDTNCAGYFDEIVRKLALSKEKTKGFYDILLRTDSTHRVNISADDDCLETSITGTNLQLFCYNGKEYKRKKAGSVICVDNNSEGYYENCYYFRKTLAQVYAILLEEKSHLKPYLKPELPVENIKYDAEDKSISYMYEDKNLLINMEDEYRSTTIYLIENAEFTELKMATGD
jgi:hypothetical protein